MTFAFGSAGLRASMAFDAGLTLAGIAFGSAGLRAPMAFDAGVSTTACLTVAGIALATGVCIDMALRFFSCSSWP